MTDFSRLQRMSLGAFIILFIKSFRSIIAASVIYLGLVLFDSNQEKGSVWIKMCYFFMSVGGIAAFLACCSYFTKKFYVKDGNLVFKHGLLMRQTATIPLSRVHSLRTKQGIWYRMAGVRGIAFDTLASMGEEIELILSEKDWQSLLHSIEAEEQPVYEQETSVQFLFNKRHTFQFDNRNLLWDALCQNHLKGMAIIGSALAVIFQWLGDLPGDTLDTVEDYMKSLWDDSLLSFFNIVIFLMAVYMVVLILWLGKVILRYYNMSMDYDNRLLSFSSGLFSRMSCRFAIDKVCTVWVKRNFLEERLGLCTLRLMQALFVSAKKEEDNLKLYGKDYSTFFLSWWLGKDYASEQEIISSRSGKIMYLFGKRRSRIILRESYIEVYMGRLARIENYIKYGNIEVVKIRRSPFARFTHRATLKFSTSGSFFSVRSIPEREAEMICNYILEYARKYKKC